MTPHNRKCQWRAGFDMLRQYQISAFRPHYCWHDLQACPTSLCAVVIRQQGSTCIVHELSKLNGAYPAGTWQQYVVVKVDNLFPVRSEVSNEDASQFFVNPCTGQHSVMSSETSCKIPCLHSLTVRVLFGS